jgi:hypothetical protein
MPFGDRTGPAGQGPRTGRGAGFCGGFGAPGSMNRGGGQGLFGRGRGGAGRGWRHCFHATGLTGWQRAWGARSQFAPPDVAGVTAAVSEDELTALRSQAESLQTTLNQMRTRIEELQAKPKQD